MLGSCGRSRRPGREVVVSEAPAVLSASDRRVDIVNRTTRLAAVGAGAGLVAGVATGVLARLAMRALAATSPHARGRITDDQAVVGVISANGTAFLLILVTILGALTGLVYAGARFALPGPPSVRATAFGVVTGLLGGSVLVKDSTSFDFGVLSPQWFAVLAFTLIPAFCGWLAAVLVEWWHQYGEERPPWLDGAVVVVALGILAAFPVSVPLLIIALVVAQVPVLARTWQGRPGRLLVRTVLVAAASYGLVGLAADNVSIATGTPSESGG
jgi:hypothetical protein